MQYELSYKATKQICTSQKTSACEVISLNCLLAASTYKHKLVLKEYNNYNMNFNGGA